MCVCTQIYIMSVCVLACKTNEKVLDGVKRLISHYGEQRMNKAADRRETIREKCSGVSLDGLKKKCGKLFFNF